MQFMTANDAKKHFGKLLDTARREPVSVQKHGRPVAVMLSVEDYEVLEQIKHEHLKAAIVDGLNSGDSPRSAGDVQAAAKARLKNA